MTEREIAIKTAVNFLSAVYGNERSWDMSAMATIHCAEADGNTKVLCEALDGVASFCKELVIKLNKTE